MTKAKLETDTQGIFQRSESPAALQSGSIGRRLLVLILLFSSLITLILTAGQLYIDYQKELDAIENRFHEIESSYLGSIAGSLWDVDHTQLKRQLEGITRLPDMRLAEVREIISDVKRPISMSAGNRSGRWVIARNFTINYQDRGTPRIIGTLRIEAALDQVYQRLIDKALVILASQGIETFLVCFFILFVVFRLVTRHLTTIANHLARYELQDTVPPLRLERSPGKRADEIDHVVNAFNELEANLRGAHLELRQANDQLELRVHERTEQLREEVEERKRIEDHLVQANKIADTANRAKSDLMANMSHELRTPLNAIIGFSGSIKEEIFGPIGNEKYREYLGDIQLSGQHLLDLINDILDVSAIEAGALELHEENINLNEIIDVSIRLLRPLADRNKVKLSVEKDARLSQIRADERRIKQALLNLLSNAIKFTPEEGSVMVATLLQDDGSLAISVSDTGIGMDEQDVEKALSMFQQVDSGLNRKHEGTGLGLPLTKGLIELHGGTLNVKSKKGFGTKITVTLPNDRIVSDNK